MPPEADAELLNTGLEEQAVAAEDPAVAGDAVAGADDAAAAAGDDQAGEGEELIVTIGDDAPAEDDAHDRAPDWVRDLRKANREKDRRIRELEAKVASATPAPAAIVVGEKPTLAGCEYDEAKFETELQAWHDRKRTVEDEQRNRADAEKRAQDEWRQRLEAHNKAASSLKVADFEDAQDVAREIFSVVQQGIMIKGVSDAETAAKLIYALGKNPKKAKELAAISDPVQFAVAIGEVKTMLKTAPRKAAPVPERVIRGNSPAAVSTDAKLEQLRAEAAKTGDFTKVHQYRQQIRASKQAA